MLEKKKKKSTPNQKYSMLQKRANKFLKQNKKRIEDDDYDEDEEPEAQSSFKNHLDRLKKLKEEGVKGETYDIEVLNSLHELVLELIPVAEESYRKYPSHTAASAVNQYMSQAREIEADLRSLESFKERALVLVDIIQKEYIDITENMIESVCAIEQRFKKSKDLSKEIKECMKEQGEFLKRNREALSERVLQMLVSGERKKSR